MIFKINILVSTVLLSILSVFLTACDDDGRGTPATSKFESVKEDQAVTQYQVNPSDLSITLNSGSPRDEDLPAWQEIVKLLPDDILKQQVAEYQVFTDGQDNVLAFVNLYELDVSKWTLGIDYQDAQNPNSSQFATTVVHEFAHILSLETEQVERYFSICQNFQVNEGCAKEDSYLNSFYNQFWKGAFHEEHQSLIAGLTNEEKPSAIVEFYDKYPDSFVSEYSANNPVEDIAESFAHFVLSDKITNPTSIKDKKINFFYNYPKLVEVRDEIRMNTSVRM